MLFNHRSVYRCVLNADCAAADLWKIRSLADLLLLTRKKWPLRKKNVGLVLNACEQFIYNIRKINSLYFRN